MVTDPDENMKMTVLLLLGGADSYGDVMVTMTARMQISVLYSTVS